MKNSLKAVALAAVTVVVGSGAIANFTSANDSLTNDCKAYECLTIVREKANRFNLTKKVFQLTNDFINKVESKAKEKYQGIDTKEGMAYQQRIYTVTSQKFLDTSILLKNEKFANSIKNAERLSKICYDLAQIFKVRAEIAAGRYTGGHYFYDKLWKFDVNAARNIYNQLADAVKGLKDALNREDVIKNGAYDEAKKYYDNNYDKSQDKNLSRTDAESLRDGFNKAKDSLSFDKEKNRLQKDLADAVNALKTALERKDVTKDGAYDEAKKYLADNDKYLKGEGLTNSEIEKMIEKLKSLKNNLKFDGNSTNSTTNDTLKIGNKLADFRRDVRDYITSDKKEDRTINEIMNKYFDGAVVSGYKVDTDYTLGLTEGSQVVLTRGQSSDFTRYLTSGSNRLSPITLGSKTGSWQFLWTKYAKMYNSRITGVEQGKSDVDTDGIRSMIEIYKGFFDKNDEYYGFAPFRDKDSAKSFITEQGLDGGKTFQIGETGKYAVVFPAVN